MRNEVYKVDFSDPGRLRAVLDAYLRLKVCPVEAESRPALLFPTTVEISLPDGGSMTRWGMVIRYLGERGFLVQFDGPLDIASLEKMAGAPEEPATVVPPVPIPDPEPVAPPAPIPDPEPVAPPVPIPDPEPVAPPAPIPDPEPVAPPEPDVAPTLKTEGIPDGWGSTGEFDVPETEDDEPLEPEEVPDDAPAEPKVASAEMTAVHKHIESLSPLEKQRLARSGNRIARGLLAKDRNKSVHQFVFRNPKITIEEVMEYSKLSGLSKDAVRIIASSRTWLASRQVVLGLVRNPATPADLLPGLVQRLGPSQWRVLAKSSDVRTQVSSLAKKLLLQA